jgi:transposase
MATRDVRKLQPEAIYELRQRAVELKRSGHTHDQIATMLDVSRAASRLWWKRFSEVGITGLSMGQRGRPKGACRTLSPAQERAIQKTIIDKTPEQLKMDFALWTRPAIALYILKRYGVKLPVRTLGHYLRRWGFTPQRPRRVAYEQQPESVCNWIDHAYPRIAARALREDAEILWGDEMGISNQDHAGRGFAPRGRTPTIRGLAQRVTISMISAIGNRGDSRFMIYKGGLNSGIFIRFMRRLIKWAKRKIFLIVDNLRVHKSKAVLAWVAAHKEQIELFFLPPYSPELNPDEYLNNTIKGKMRSATPKGAAKELHAKLLSTMKSTQSNRKLISSLFGHPKVLYAA